jgi:hypothetical protein
MSSCRSPTIVQKLPRAISNEMPSSATNGPERVAKLLRNPAIRILGGASAGSGRAIAY